MPKRISLQTAKPLVTVTVKDRWSLNVIQAQHSRGGTNLLVSGTFSKDVLSKAQRLINKRVSLSAPFTATPAQIIALASRLAPEAKISVVGPHARVTVIAKNPASVESAREILDAA